MVGEEIFGEAWLVRRYLAGGRMRERGEENNREDRRGREVWLVRRYFAGGRMRKRGGEKRIMRRRV